MAEEIQNKVSNLETDVAILKTTVNDHSKLLQSQMEKNETLVEMKTLMAIQIEDGKKRDKQMEKFEGTLLKVNDNLTNLNNSQQQLNNNQIQLGDRVDNIESTLQEQKIDPIKLFKSILSYIITGAGSILIAYLLYKLGISNN